MAAVQRLGKQWSIAARVTEDHELVTEGPYRIVRNPIYTGMFGMMVATAIVGTLAALALGLLIASAKTSYDTQSSEVRQVAANISQLDRVLADYGSETKEIRDAFRRNIQHLTDEVWQRGSARSVILGSPETEAETWAIHVKILQLAPRDDIQQALALLRRHL